MFSGSYCITGHCTQAIALAAHLLDALLAGDGLAWAFAGAGVGARALTADRQAALVAHTAITIDLAQTSDVLLDLTTQRPLDGGWRWR